MRNKNNVLFCKIRGGISKKVVEAFNTTFAAVLAESPRPFGTEKTTIFYCGDDVAAKSIATQLINECDCDAVDAGGLHTARAMELMATAWVQFAAVSGLFPMLGLKALLPTDKQPS